MLEISPLLLTAICVIVVIKVSQIMYKQFKIVALIDQIPGPKTYPILGNVLDFLRVSRDDRHKWIQGLCSQYEGGIFRMWLGMEPGVHLTSAETAGAIFSSNSLITKSSSYDTLRQWFGSGLLTSTGEKWHRQRKLITPTFHFNILEQFAGPMSEKAEILKQCIELELEKNPQHPIDMFDLLTRCALDIICESAMGSNINALTNPASEYLMALHEITILVVKRALRPWLKNDCVYDRTSEGKRFKYVVETTHEFTEKVITEKKLARKIQQQNPDTNFETDKPKRQAFLDHLLDACDRGTTSLTDEELRQEVDTFMFAGHDTTAAGMTWALFCIGNHPDVEEKIHEEQLRVFGDSTEPATYHQLAELKYLERVIKETLRLFPSVPTISRNATEDFEVAGYKIPKDTVVTLHLHYIHRNPKHWSDPNKFDPDRFLPENSNGRHPYAYVPFSAGPRNCIGQKLALLEEKTVLTAILRSWRVKSLLKYNEITCNRDMILKPVGGMKIYFTPK